MKYEDLKPGEFIIADDGFSCMEQGRKLVFKDEVGLYVVCSGGRHYLDGSVGTDGHLIGFSRHS